MNSLITIPVLEANEIIDFKALSNYPRITIPRATNNASIIIAQKHKKYSYIYLMIGTKLAYCEKCNKYISSDSGNISKHINSKHLTIEQWVCSVDDIIKFISKNSLPHAIIKSDSFIKLFPYIIPSYDTFEKKFHELYLVIQTKIRTILNNANYYSLCLDEWTRYNYNFIGITVTVDDKYYLLSLTCPDDISRSAEVISRTLNEGLSYYGIDKNKIISACTD